MSDNTRPRLYLEAMSELGLWPRFVLAVLATWRVTHLLAREDGPANLIARFRSRLGTGLPGQLMDCFNCLSFWVAAPAAFFVCEKPLDRLLAWLALSGAACLLERTGEQPVVIHPVTRKEESPDAMLWPESERVETGYRGSATTDPAPPATRG